MSQFDDSGFKTFSASAAIAQFARVTLAADGTIAESAIGEKDIGTATREAFVSGDLVSVRLRTKEGTHKMIAVEAIAAGAAVFTEASGKVQDTAASGAFPLGTAMETVTADNDIIEVLYNSHGDTVVP